MSDPKIANKHELCEVPEIDEAKVDEATLALLYLVVCESHDGYARAWKSFDWETMNRLHEKGMIYDPVGKTKSVHLTQEGFKKSKELFYSLFGKNQQDANPTATPTTVIQFHAELLGYKPQMWRRFQVAGDISIAQLAYIIMTLFEMKASHLLSIEHHRHCLTPGGTVGRKTKLLARYGFPGEDLMEEEVEAATVKLSQLDLSKIDRLLVWYDFGDDWQVWLTPEPVKIEDSGLSAKELPRVLEGKGFGIIEDCGGVGGLVEIAEAYQKKEGEKYENYREWLGVDDLDLTAFDVGEMNYRLKKIPQIYANIYEHKMCPSKAERRLIERTKRRKKTVKK